MKKFYEFLKLIGRRADLLLHHVAAGDIALLVFAILAHFLPWGWALAIADVVAALAIFLKEVYNYFHPDTQTVEIADLQAGLLAIAYVTVILVLLFAFL